MQFTLEHLDILLLILTRVTGFVYTGPFFSLGNVPNRVKILFSVVFSFVLFGILPYEPITYTSDFHYITVLATEAACGVIVGFFANMGYYILSYAGSLIDIEIGFSMVSTLDPVTNTNVTITSNLYSYLVVLVMMITDLHHYIIKAFSDAYQIVPIGNVVIHPELYKKMVSFMGSYFLIGFRIILPVFMAILLVNVVLGIMAKVAPQMNMFVVGMQLKVLVGLVVLYFVIQMIPSVGDFIFNTMIKNMKEAIYSMV